MKEAVVLLKLPEVPLPARRGTTLGGGSRAHRCGGSDAETLNTRLIGRSPTLRTGEIVIYSILRRAVPTTIQHLELFHQKDGAGKVYTFNRMFFIEYACEWTALTIDIVDTYDRS